MMMEKRHTVRKYLDKPLDMDLIGLLNDRIERNNCVYNLTFKLITNNSDGLSSLARLMSNNSVQNYIILAGKDNSDLDKKRLNRYIGDMLIYSTLMMSI
jgi:hypothetical protein